MRFSEDFLSELRARVDIEELVGKYTEIKHRGSRTPVALCPFHTEKTPSFVIYRDTQSYYCFGCGMGGDAINFVRNIERPPSLLTTRVSLCGAGATKRTARQRDFSTHVCRCPRQSRRTIT